MRTAFLGLGRMGTPMARRLLAAGHVTVVWNRTAARAEPLVAEGAIAAASPAEAASGADLVISSLAGPSAVEEVLAGPQGAFGALRPDALVVEMSTIGPAAVTDLARRLPAHAGIVDAPVLGSVPAAEAGKLTVLVGGEQTAVARVVPVLEELGSVVQCGRLGSGAALKLVVNAGMITAVTVLGETLSLARSLQVPTDRALELLARGPLAGVVARAGNDSGGQFPMANAAKDLGLVREVVGAGRLPQVDAAYTYLRKAAERGTADQDFPAVLDHIHAAE